LQKKIRIESKTISQNLLLQKELRDEIKKKSLNNQNLEEKIKKYVQEVNLCRLGSGSVFNLKG
jgi:hypothetical protein